LSAVVVVVGAAIDDDGVDDVLLVGVMIFGMKILF